LKYLKEKCKEESDNINVCVSEYMKLDPFILFSHN
jgi:hypothetical protein